MLIVCCLFISQHVYAAQKTAQSFDAWLETYQAWDVFEQELSMQSPSAKNVLARAETLVRLNQPQKVIELLGQPYPNSDQEKQRLVLRARSQRLLGMYDECVLTWLKLTQTVPQEIYLPLIAKEPGLALLFEDIWKQWFWASFFTQNSGVHDSRRPLMNQMLALGNQAWPQNVFWKQAQPVYAHVQVSTPRPDLSLQNTVQISEEQTRIGKALAYWSLGFWDKGDLLLIGLANKQRALFWGNMGVLLGHPEGTSSGLSPSRYRTDSLGTDQSFFTLFAPKIRATSTWLLAPPDAPSWSSFVDRLTKESLDQALATIDQEQGSVFLPPQIQQGLSVCRFALALQKDDIQNLKQSWMKLIAGNKHPPLLLGLAYMILGGQPELPEDVQEAAMLTYLGQAAGTDAYPDVLGFFWDTPATTQQIYPLDYLQTYVSLTRTMETAPNHVDSMHLAFLFPHSPAAQKALLFLARETNKNGNKKLAWAYLQKIQTKDLDQDDRVEFLLAKAGMEMELGYEDAALRDYGILMQENPGRVPLEKQLKLALLGQQKRQWTWAQGILEGLWDKRALVDEQIRAEILFWLGEGAQSQGKLGKALEYYLRLAWSYPGQNIWAVTAMYRAGLIYEKRGEF
ncbi:MAG: tetratricopeptide repeat protein, partial [Desulfoplanes sp.]|nr:tetratricopeptide repeat protein [Desulfoplanes sp.]